MLPVAAPDKHTLIVTRNAGTGAIPARGLEVPLLGVDDSLELLYTLSELNVNSERDEAIKIVRELRYLPLAIAQAALYVRQVANSFEEFLKDYQLHRQALQRWTLRGNGQYSHSIATTSDVSFKVISPPAAKLLQLFSFLNPDNILLEFL